MQIIIDERADPAQREALLKIMTGQDTDEFATMWAVFSAMSPNKLEPLFRPIEYEIDIEARRGRFRIPPDLSPTNQAIGRMVSRPPNPNWSCP
jgi:hypothetical protein